MISLTRTNTLQEVLLEKNCEFLVADDIRCVQQKGITLCRKLLSWEAEA